MTNWRWKMRAELTSILQLFRFPEDQMLVPEAVKQIERIVATYGVEAQEGRVVISETASQGRPAKTARPMCDDCGVALEMSEGCYHCPYCGSSKCD